MPSSAWLDDQSETSVSHLETGRTESTCGKSQETPPRQQKQFGQRQAAEHINHVRSWDFISDRTASGKQLKWLVIIDEFARENLCVEVGHSFEREDLIDCLVAISVERGFPKFSRSDNGTEFIAGPL